MSGTSLDGVDAALVRISGSGAFATTKLLAFDTYRFPKGFRELVLKNSLPGSGTVDAISRLNILYAHLFADAVKKIARKGRTALVNIDLVGSHGQTIHHLAINRHYHRRRFPYRRYGRGRAGRAARSVL
jgi:anhydro-N-acetylmuramic acid kinase